MALSVARWAIRALLTVLVVLIGIQFVRPDRTNPPLNPAHSLLPKAPADVRAVLGEEAVKSRFVATSQLISPGTSTEFAASIEEQRKKLAAIAQKLGVKAAQ